MYKMQLRSCLAMTKMKIDSGDGPKIRECVDKAPKMSCIDFEACMAMSGFDMGLMNEALDGQIENLGL